MVIFRIWAWFGPEETCRASLPRNTKSSHFMWKSVIALSTFLARMLARGPLEPAEASSLRGEGMVRCSIWKLQTQEEILYTVIIWHLNYFGTISTPRLLMPKGTTQNPGRAYLEKWVLYIMHITISGDSLNYHTISYSPVEALGHDQNIVLPGKASG